MIMHDMSEAYNIFLCWEENSNEDGCHLVYTYIWHMYV